MKTWTTRNVAAFIALLWAMLATDAASAQAIKVYGPGGPAPTVKEVALLFKREKNIDVEVVAGPTSNWLAQAKQDAHVVFSGSENMMLSFLAAFDGRSRLRRSRRSTCGRRRSLFGKAIQRGSRVCATLPSRACV